MYSIFLAIHLKFILKLFAVLVNCLQGFMQMKLMMGNIDHTACNIGTVIGCSFKAGQKIGPYEACDHIAISLLHTQNVAGTHLLLQCINNLL